MEGMEEKLGAILENPQLMQQIMQLAQSVNIPKPSQSREPPKKEEPPPKISLPDTDIGAGLDPAMLLKLEKAMRAAKIASMASAFLNSGGMKLLSGR